VLKVGILFFSIVSRAIGRWCGDGRKGEVEEGQREELKYRYLK